MEFSGQINLYCKACQVLGNLSLRVLRVPFNEKPKQRQEATFCLFSAVSPLVACQEEPIWAILRTLAEGLSAGQAGRSFQLKAGQHCSKSPVFNYFGVKAAPARSGPPLGVAGFSGAIGGTSCNASKWCVRRPLRSRACKSTPCCPCSWELCSSSWYWAPRLFRHR